MLAMDYGRHFRFCGWHFRILIALRTGGFEGKVGSGRQVILKKRSGFEVGKTNADR